MYFENSLELKQYLVSFLTPYLGTLTLPNGTVSPAVFVGKVPIGTKILGLELNIPKDFSGSNEFLTGGVAPSKKFEFRLIQHSGSNTFSDAVNLVYQKIIPVNFQYLPAVLVASDQGKSGSTMTLDEGVFTFSRSALIKL